MYNKNRPVMTLELTGRTVTKITEVLDRDFLPFALQDDPTAESVTRWLQKRLIPEKREGLAQARKLFPGFDNEKNMFSLSDQYWFRYNRNENWEKMNFFTNRYGEETGRIFFEPWLVDEERLKKERSPDITTNGVLTKCWIQDENMTSYLIKANSPVFHQEPISEVMASIILKRLKIIPFVEYELVIYGLRFCSKCRNFVDKNTEFVPAAQIYNREGKREEDSVYTHLVKMCEKYEIPNAKNAIHAMIAADYIIGNTDRHLGNFGFLRNVENGEITGFAPLFDSGNAFWEDSSNKRIQEKNIFHGFGKNAVNKIIDRINVKKVSEEKELLRLVDTYPCLSDKKRELVKKQIKRISSILSGMKEKERPGR